MIASRRPRLWSSSSLTVHSSLMTPRASRVPERGSVGGHKIHIFTDNNLKAMKSYQESHTNKRRRPLQFEVGDHVYLKVLPMKGMKRFGVKGKLSPRYIGPFLILEKCGTVTYKLELPPSLAGVHDIFHVS
jgi:hypothetical protein